MSTRILTHANTKTQNIAYSSLVGPILEYDCIMWDPFSKTIKRFEKIQNIASRSIFKLKVRLVLRR